MHEYEAQAVGRGPPLRVKPEAGGRFCMMLIALTAAVLIGKDPTINHLVSTEAAALPLEMVSDKEDKIQRRPAWCLAALRALGFLGINAIRSYKILMNVKKHKAKEIVFF